MGVPVGDAEMRIIVMAVFRRTVDGYAIVVAVAIVDEVVQHAPFSYGLYSYGIHSYGL